MPQFINNESPGFTHYFRFNADELASGGTGARTIGLVPRGGIVTNVAVTVIKPIVGASGITISVGFPAAPTGLITSTDLDVLVATVFDSSGYVNDSAEPIAITATIGGTVVDITDGEIVIAMTIFDPFAII